MALVLAAAAGIIMPALAQLPDSFQFLDAVRKSDGAKVEKLIAENGATIVNARDSGNSQTALHIATARRDRTWMTYLIQKGANVNVRDDRGVTPLLLASNLRFVEGVELLVANKAQVDDTDQAGETPLISSVHNNNVALLRLLLAAGADPDRADNSGRSARDYAVIEGRGGPLLNEIENSAKQRPPARPASGAYGPSL